MVEPSKIIRTNRRTLSLTIDKDGALIVRAPKKLSLDFIFKFIKEKENWIINKQRAIKNNLLSAQDVMDYETLMILGKPYAIKEINNSKRIEIVNNTIYIPEGLELNKRINILQRYLVKIASSVLITRLDYFANLMKLSYNKAQIIKSYSKWGSCDNKANIKLNFKLIMLPHTVVDYVLIHELAHLLELNHSAAFYKIVESVMPKWKEVRLQLKELNYLLRLF